MKKYAEAAKWGVFWGAVCLMCNAVCLFAGEPPFPRNHSGVPLVEQVTPQPTAVPTSTYAFTSTPSYTGTPTKTPTVTKTPTPAYTPTKTRTPTVTPTKTQTLVGTSPTYTPVNTNTPTPTPTGTPSYTPTVTDTPTVTETVTNTYTVTDTYTATATYSPTTWDGPSNVRLWKDSNYKTGTPTWVPALVDPIGVTIVTPTATPTPTGTLTPTATPTPDVNSMEMVQAVITITTPTTNLVASVTFSQAWSKVSAYVFTASSGVTFSASSTPQYAIYDATLPNLQYDLGGGNVTKTTWTGGRMGFARAVLGATAPKVRRLQLAIISSTIDGLSGGVGQPVTLVFIGSN